MKIIGRTSDGFILQATEEEVGSVAGLTFPTYRNHFGIGDEVQVSHVFSHLLQLENNRGSLAQHAREIRAIADLLEAKNPVLKAEAEAVKELHKER